MRRGASLGANEARLHVLKERKSITMLELTADDDITRCIIGSAPEDNSVGAVTRGHASFRYSFTPRTTAPLPFFEPRRRCTGNVVRCGSTS